MQKWEYCHLRRARDGVTVVQPGGKAVNLKEKSLQWWLDSLGLEGWEAIGIDTEP